MTADEEARAHIEELRMCSWTLAAVHVVLADGAEPRPFRPVSVQRPDRHLEPYRNPCIRTPLPD